MLFCQTWSVVFWRELIINFKKKKKGCSRLGRVSCPPVKCCVGSRVHPSVLIPIAQKKMLFFFSKNKLAQVTFILSPSCSAQWRTKRALAAHEAAMWFMLELVTGWHTRRHTILPPLVNYSSDKAALTEICWVAAYNITQTQVHSSPFLCKAGVGQLRTVTLDRGSCSL